MKSARIPRARFEFVETIETRVQKMSWGARWTMALEKWVTSKGTVKYTIYHSGGQSYPVGEYQSLGAAYKMLDSFELYKKEVANA
jgi:hypothetical protein